MKVKRGAVVVLFFALLLCVLCACGTGDSAGEEENEATMVRLSNTFLEKELSLETGLLENLTFVNLVKTQPSEMMIGEVVEIEPCVTEYNLPEAIYDSSFNALYDPKEFWNATGEIIKIKILFPEEFSSDSEYYEIMSIEGYENEEWVRKTPYRHLKGIEVGDRLLIFDNEREVERTYITDGSGQVISLEEQIVLETE